MTLLQTKFDVGTACCAACYEPVTSLLRAGNRKSGVTKPKTWSCYEVTNVTSAKHPIEWEKNCPMFSGKTPRCIGTEIFPYRRYLRNFVTS